MASQHRAKPVLRSETWAPGFEIGPDGGTPPPLLPGTKCFRMCCLQAEICAKNFILKDLLVKNFILKGLRGRKGSGPRKRLAFDLYFYSSELGGITMQTFFGGLLACFQ